MLYDITYQIADDMGGYYSPGNVHLESEDTVSEQQARTTVEGHETIHAPNPNWTRNLSRRIKIIAIDLCEGHEEEADEK